MILFKQLSIVTSVLAFASTAALAQELNAPDDTAVEEVKPVQVQVPPDKRVFGVLPNYRTANDTGIYTPITASENAFKLGEQLGTDAISQVLKEFWPDIKRKLFQRHKEP